MNRFISGRPASPADHTAAAQPGQAAAHGSPAEPAQAEAPHARPAEVAASKQAPETPAQAAALAHERRAQAMAHGMQARRPAARERRGEALAYGPRAQVAAPRERAPWERPARCPAASFPAPVSGRPAASPPVPRGRREPAAARACGRPGAAPGPKARALSRVWRPREGRPERPAPPAALWLERREPGRARAAACLRPEE